MFRLLRTYLLICNSFLILSLYSCSDCQDDLPGDNGFVYDIIGEEGQSLLSNIKNTNGLAIQLYYRDDRDGTFPRQPQYLFDSGGRQLAFFNAWHKIELAVFDYDNYSNDSLWFINKIVQFEECNTTLISADLVLNRKDTLEGFKMSEYLENVFIIDKREVFD
jgi:hypothetical protein